MKILLKRLIFNIVNPFFEIFFFISIKSSEENIWVIDIDNTIADTWKTLKVKNISETMRLRNLELLDGTKRFLEENSKNATQVFLTARNYNSFFVTRKWLKKNNFKINIFNVIMVMTPNQKINYLKKIAIKKNVFFIDDLSYNHENGEVKFYESCIDEVKKLPLTFFDYDFILNLNKRN